MKTVDELMALADDLAQAAFNYQMHQEQARAVLLAALQEQAREGEAVANSAILARGRFHAFKGEDGEPDDWEWFEEGTNCEHGCIDAVIVRADAIAAPQPAQPESIECDCGRIHKKTRYGWACSEPAQPEQVERTRARSEFWKAALGDNSKLANLAKAAIKEAESSNKTKPAWIGLSTEERDNLVGDLVDYGTETVAPLYSVIEQVERNLKERNASLQSAQPVALPLTDEQINLMVHSQHFDPSYKLKASDMVCVNWYKLGLRDGERAHGIGGAL